jgi:hypothetical protein
MRMLIGNAYNGPVAGQARSAPALRPRARGADHRAARRASRRARSRCTRGRSLCTRAAGSTCRASTRPAPPPVASDTAPSLLATARTRSAGAAAAAHPAAGPARALKRSGRLGRCRSTSGRSRERSPRRSSSCSPSRLPASLPTLSTSSSRHAPPPPLSPARLRPPAPARGLYWLHRARLGAGGDGGRPPARARTQLRRGARA